MARTPQGSDLMRDPKAAATPAVRARAVDYSPQLQATRSLQRAGNSVSKGFEIAAQKAQEYEDHETKLKLAEFRLQTERDLEDHRKTMAPGAAGWESGWQKAYTKRADKFIKALPAAQRQNAHAALTRQYERLGSRANSLARGEARRFTLERLEGTLTGFTERVDRDPSSLNESRQEARRLVESADLSLAQRKVLLKRTRQQLDRTALTAKLASAKDIGSLNALDQELAGSKDAKRYDGPYKYLSVAQRRSVRGQIETQKKRIIREVRKEISNVESAAVNGVAPKEGERARIDQLVESTGDPKLKRELSSALKTAERMKSLYRLPDTAVAAAATRLRADLTNNGGTAAQDKYVRKIEALARNMKTALKNDRLQWAWKTGTVPIERLVLDDPRSMALRYEQSHQAARIFVEGKVNDPADMNQHELDAGAAEPPPAKDVIYFLNAERDVIASDLESGRRSVTKTAALLVRAWGPKAAQQEMSRLVDKAPGAALIGTYVTNFGENAPLAKDYEAGLRLKQTEGFKSRLGSVVEIRGAVADAVDAKAFALNPQGLTALRNAANVIYEQQATREGLIEFESNRYEKIVRELIGENKIGGVTYGGIADGDPGWWGSFPTFVPHDVRQDSFDDLREEIKIEDLPSHPREGGRNVTKGEFESAIWVSQGMDRYLLAADVGDEGLKAYTDHDGRPYIIDFGSLRGRLKERRRDLFAP